MSQVPHIVSLFRRRVLLGLSVPEGKKQNKLKVELAQGVKAMNI